MEDVSTFAAILLDPIIARVSKVHQYYSVTFEKKANFKGSILLFQDTFCTKMTMIAKKEDVSMR